MKKMLLVEDLKQKADAIKDHIKQTFPNVELVWRESYNSAMNEIFDNFNDYCLILLDMSMSTYDISNDEKGGEHEPLAGKEILDGMFLRNIETKVVVVTMYVKFNNRELDNVDKELAELYPDNYLGYIYFVASENEWKKQLDNFINKYVYESFNNG